MKWRVSYLKYRKNVVKWILKDQLSLFKKMATESHECEYNAASKIDFTLAFLLYGAECEDYFSFGFYKKKNPFFRNHHVTRTRLNFMKSKVNSEEAIAFLDDKPAFNRLYDKYLGRKWCCPHEVSKNEFIEKMSSDTKDIFVKVMDGRCGKGDFRSKADPETLDKLYDSLINSDTKYIVEEYFYQTGFLHEVNPSSLNTVRLTTARTPKEIIPLYSYFRAGSANSVVDNLHSGGVSYTVDIRNGKMGLGHTYKESDIRQHPSTGVEVAGTVIKNWDEVIDLAKRLHEIAPEEANLIGWDLCINDDGIIVIEGNGCPGFPEEIDFKQNTWKKVKKFMDEL